MTKHCYDEGKVTEDSDLLAASMPATVFNKIDGDAARLSLKCNQHILDDLESASFVSDSSFPSLLSLIIYSPSRRVLHQFWGAVTHFLWGY